jgi:hypothetical protein
MSALSAPNPVPVGSLVSGSSARGGSLVRGATSASGGSEVGHTGQVYRLVPLFGAHLWFRDHLSRKRIEDSEELSGRGHGGPPFVDVGWSALALPTRHVRRRFRGRNVFEVTSASAGDLPVRAAHRRTDTGFPRHHAQNFTAASPKVTTRRVVRGALPRPDRKRQHAASLCVCRLRLIGALKAHCER